MVLGKYDRPADCRGTIPHYQDCRDILHDMNADKATRTFGPRTDPSVDTTLPYSFLSCELPGYCSDFTLVHRRLAHQRCSVTIYSVGTDTASWYSLWEAVTAIYSVCARWKEAGSMRGLGEFAETRLEVDG